MRRFPHIPHGLTVLFLLAFGISFLPQPASAQNTEFPPFPKVETDADYLPTNSKLNGVQDSTLEEIRTDFAAPGVDYAPAPLWVWNDLLTEEQIRSTLRDLAGQGVLQAYVHPRPGLATPYLSDDWFRLWEAALDEARKLGMKIWIYDENSYPSGFAGGLVPERWPQSQGTGLDIGFFDTLTDANGNWTAGDSVQYVIEELADGTCVDRTAEILGAKNAGNAIPGKSPNGVRWVIGRTRYAGASQWYGGKTYVNLLMNGVADAFLTCTHEEYRKRLGHEFGKLIPGAFTDEPHIAPAGQFTWVDDFPQEFEKRRGYSLLPHLGSLAAPVGNWKKVRFDYYRTAQELLIDRWHKRLAAYCEKNGLQYCGHDWEHEWPRAHRTPDSMATAFWRQRPTIDLLMNQFGRGTNSQFGNVRSVRELISAAHQAGRSKTLSENYGAGGFDIRFEDLKRLGDWSYALGVNMTDEHLSYITIRGARKHDHPQTFSYHSAWFEQYGRLANYWTRLSYLLTRGDLTDERFLLLEPTSTSWFYQKDAGNESGKFGRIGNEFADLLNRLEAEQADYDLGSEDIIWRVGSVKNGKFTVGAASYSTVVLPANLETLYPETLVLLADFAAQGGRIVSLGADLQSVGGAAKNALSEDLKAKFDAVTQKIVTLTVEELAAEARNAASVSVLAKTNAENVFHLTRQTKDSRIVFICCIDMQNSASVKLNRQNGWENAGIEIFDPTTGERKPAEGDEFELSPCGSLALVISHKIKTPETGTQNTKPAPQLLDPWQFADSISVKPLEENVLALDYLTLKAGGETIQNEYFYRANAKLWQKHGFAKSPWDNGVQLRDTLLKHQFAENSGFEVTYQFTKSDAKIDDLRLVIEDPKDFRVECNGTPVDRIPCAWKFDRSFGVYDISAAAREGVNEIKLIAPKMTVFCELANAWILGNFTLEPAECGFRIVAPKGLAFQKKAMQEEIHPNASNGREGVSWLSSGVGFGAEKDDYAPKLTFKFPTAQKIDGIRVWNYCEQNLAKRGIRTATLSGVGELEFRLGDGTAQTILFEKPVQLAAEQALELCVNSNWNGLTYPLPNDFPKSTKPEIDNGFVGLAEIEFLTKDASGKLVPIAAPSVQASSELVFQSHDRRAVYAVNGMGQMEQQFGWAAQGWPFYSGAVDYSFTVSESDFAKDQPIHAVLPGLRETWNGAVAAVLVQGKQVGTIACHGESVDLTQALQNAFELSRWFSSLRPAKGIATVTFRIYGTPKNLFGPHHVGPLRGSAWPGSFHRAPAVQPAGQNYDFIEYGLFAF